MKKILLFASALAGLFLAASCQQESLEPVGGNTVTYTVQVPDALATKAVGDEYVADHLIYEVYRDAELSDLDKDPIYEGTATINAQGQASLELEFVKNQNFTVLFWAQKSGVAAYNTADLRQVTLNQALTSNDVNMAVYAGTDKVANCVSATNGAVTLSRPIAQLNLATAPESLTIGTNANPTITLVSSYAKVTGLSTTYNVATKAVGADESEFIYADAPVLDATLEVNSKQYPYASMNYVGFISEEGATIDVEYILTTSEGDINHTIGNVPVKPNYRTNIVGNLISSASEYTITLDAVWAGVAEEVEIWDGKFLSQPAYDNATNTWSVKKASELAWLAAAVNGEVAVTRAGSESFAGETVKLTADIDLGNHPWTPIGLTGDQAGFQGVFDGNGKTISNLYIDLTKAPKYQSAGLFGSARVGEIKNFTVKNAVVKNITTSNSDGATSCGTAVVVGSAQTQTGHKITNVHVINATVEGNRYCAAIAGYYDGAIADCTVDNVTIKVSPDKLSGTYDNGDKAGGILGYANTGVGTTIADCVVKNSTIEGYRDLGGIAGLIRKSVTGCTVENVNIVHNPLNGYKTSVTTFGAIHSGYVTPEVETGNTVTNVTIYAPENVTIVKPEESLQAAVDAAIAPAVIYLAEGTHTGHTVINKDITLLPVDGAKVVYDGHLSAQSGDVLIQDITFTNEHPSSTPVPHDSGTPTKHLSCVSAYVANVTLENCTFDIKAQTGYFDYAGSTSVLKNCVFKCNGQRPIQSRTRIDIDGCKFYDQYRYAIQVKGEISDPQVVNFKNNQIINPCVTSGKGFVAGVSISGSQKCENVTFNIEGNTLESTAFEDIKFVFDIADGVKITTCTLNGKQIAAGRCVSIPGVDDAKEVIMDYTDGLAYAVTSEDIVEAIKNEATAISLTDGSYTFPDLVNIQGKELTFVGSEDAVIDVSNINANNQFVTGATLKFEGVTLNFGTVNYMGFANTASLTYKECNINGLQFLYGQNVVFEGCSLNSNGAEHTVWTYGVKNVSFTGCDFTYGDRGVNCYNDNDVPGGQTVNFTNCTFATENTASEGAVEINSCYISEGIVVNMEGCTAPAYGEMAYVSHWDSTNGLKTTINIK